MSALMRAMQNAKTPEEQQAVYKAIITQADSDRVQADLIAEHNRMKEAGIRGEAAAKAEGELPAKLMLEQEKAAQKRAGDMAPSGAAATRQFKNEQALRKEFTAASKDFIAIRDAYNTILANKGGSAAGDVGLIFALMKMFDPASTVREGEFATAANTGSIPTRIWAAYNKAVAGERLTPGQREDFVNTAKRTYTTQAKSQKQTEQRYRRLAIDAGMNPENVIFGYEPAEGDTPGESDADIKATLKLE